MKNQTYIRCPRCELNYILKKDKFCNVCKQEMKAVGALGAEEDMDLDLCPICKINYINPDEDICPACAKERELEEGENGSKFNREDEWSSYTNSDDDDSSFGDEETGDMVSITNLDDTPLDDDMDLDLSDDDATDDETFDGDFDDSFDNLDDDEDFDDDAIFFQSEMKERMKNQKERKNNF